MSFTLSTLPPSLTEVFKIRGVKINESRSCTTLTIEFSPEMLDDYGYIHGSIISTLNIIGAESAARFNIRDGEVLIVVNANLNFIKQPEVFDDLEVESCIVTRTDRLILVSTVIRCGESDIGRGSVLFVIEKIE
ncbi:MAG TPA: hypothetical protein EYP48_02040 [Ignisphaera sp.]|uniref:PaaI family thioesterase n=1 Tax=Ignisphaera aggregans TaxID=334771 RepID=A0A832YZP6_9CREN|nr:hypothetical protein [Ignisphaera sp.]HIP57201.1 hypothetical protein [Ignisphaera aggregans]